MKITGRIHVPSGVTFPASGVTVSIYNVDDSNPYGNKLTGYVGSTGGYEIRRVPAGRYALQVDVPLGSGLADEWYKNQSSMAAATPLTVSSGVNLSHVDIKLDRPAMISGNVTLPKAVSATKITVTAYDAAHKIAGSASPSADGRYTIELAGAGSYRLFFDARDATGVLSRWSGDKPSFESATASTVTAGGDVEVAPVTLLMGGSVSGRITYAKLAGTAWDMLTVSVYAGELVDGKPKYVTAATANADGTYRVVGLPTGTYRVRFELPYSLDAIVAWYKNVPDFASSIPIKVVAGNATTGIDADLTILGTISGKVSLPAGASSAPKEVAVCAMTSATKTVRCASSLLGDGSYRIVGLPAGTYRLQFRPSSSSKLAGEWWNNAPTFTKATPVTVARGQVRTGLNAVLGWATTGSVVAR